MQDINVVVIFHSRFGSTERLALAAAVGAVNGRANIRLRLLPDAADEIDDAAIASVPEWRENRARMNLEYVAPRDSDILWADAILFGIPAGARSIQLEFERYLAACNATLNRSGGNLKGKIAASFMEGFWTARLYAALEGLGLTTIPLTPAANASEDGVLEAARRQGRRIAEEARSRRAPGTI